MAYLKQRKTKEFKGDSLGHVPEELNLTNVYVMTLLI